MAVIAVIVSTLAYAMLTLILVRVVFSWVSRDVDSPIYKSTYVVTEPLMGPVRGWIPQTMTAGLDLSPAVVAVALFFVIAIFSRLY
jgi:YggT family protein